MSEFPKCLQCMTEKYPATLLKSGLILLAEYRDGRDMENTYRHLCFVHRRFVDNYLKSIEQERRERLEREKGKP